MQWKRAREIRPSFSIFGPSIVPTDIKQGAIGDCYVLAALASLAERPSRVHEMFYNAKNASGCYLIKFYVNGIPTGVMVDDLFLCNGSDLIFARCKGDEFWVALIEKAYAKLLGSYTRLPSGSTYKVMHTLTGAPASNFDHDPFRNDENLKDAHWERLKSCDKQHMMMCLSSNQGESPEEQGADGIVRGHAYSLLAVYEFEHYGEIVKLLKVRNPWASNEWKGAWSDGSGEWTPQLDAKLGHTNEDDGVFFIPYDDMLDKYRSTHICCNPDPEIYTHQKLMIDFNSSEFPGVAFLRVELREEYEFTEETFGVYCNQQGDVLGGVRKAFNPHIQVTIDTLVIDPDN